MTGPRESVFSVDTVRIETPGGAIERGVVRHPGGAVILPFLPDGRVVTLRNRRPAIGRSLIELPAGTRKDREEVQRTAARELEEETGYRAGRLWPLGSFYSSPGFLDECMHAFVAEDLEPGPPRRDPGEEMEVEPMALAQLEELAHTGVLQDAKTLAVLYLWTVRASSSGPPDGGVD